MGVVVLSSALNDKPVTGPNSKMESDFIKLVVRQFGTSDFDAEHPVWLYLIKKYDLDYVPALWLCFLYMAFYDEASAWVAYQESDPFTMPKRIDLPIRTNRRNLWAGKIKQHLESLCKLYNSSDGWPTHNFTGCPKRDWTLLKDNIGEVWGNGRFGLYTTAEMLHKVLDLPVEVTGFDNENSSGPADGIKRIYGCSDSIADLDHYTQVAYDRVLRCKLHPTYTMVDRGVVESVLCNFGAVCRGKFYSGRNVDRQQGSITKVEGIVGERDLVDLWDARSAVFKREHLGEFSGWEGIDRPRLKLYQRSGHIPWTHEMR